MLSAHASDAVHCRKELWCDSSGCMSIGETNNCSFMHIAGDSLLFAAGAFAALGHLNVAALLAVFISSAILGDALNYQLGKMFGWFPVTPPHQPQAVVIPWFNTRCDAANEPTNFLFGSASCFCDYAGDRATRSNLVKKVRPRAYQLKLQATGEQAVASKNLPCLFNGLPFNLLLTWDLMCRST